MKKRVNTSAAKEGNMNNREIIKRRIELKKQLIMITRKEIKELEGLLKVKVDIKNDNMA